MIAGHTFIVGLCGCGIRWVDIRNCEECDVDKQGIAHTGRLSMSEYNQIRAEREREDIAIANAMGYVSAT